MTFCELSHNGAADSLLDKKCMYCNCEIKYVYIANWFPLGESWKILRVHSWYCFVSQGEVVFVTATSLLMASLLLPTYHTALRECLYFLCQVIQAVGDPCVDIRKLCRTQTASTIFTVLVGFWISGFLRTWNLFAIIPNTFSTILRALDNR